MRGTRVFGAWLLGLGLAAGGFWAGSRWGRPAGSAAPGSAPGRRILYDRNPMDPSVHSAAPARDSMGMEYVPVYAGEAQPFAAPVAGRAALTIDAERRQLLGIRSEAVSAGPLARTIRTVGRVAVDERRLHHVHTKYDGYVEHLYVDFTGKLVRPGEPLLSIYSPELVATQEEYLLALRARRDLAAGGSPLVAGVGSDLVEATRRRLELWDVPRADIERLERTGEVRRTLDLYSESGGYVVQKMAFHGMRVTPADSLFDIADLSRLWVLADVYESDLPAVRLGMPAEVSLGYIPGKNWRGGVTFVAPAVEEATRTVKVRIEIENQGGELKPDMFADVRLFEDLGRGLAVPESAVIDAGDRKLVFLDRGQGRYQPREVKLGARVGDRFQVLSGLAEGDAVVASANFLLDSESSLRAALAAGAATDEH